MSEETILPTQSYALPVPQWDVSVAARLIADAALPEETAQGQTRRFVKNGWMPTVGRRGHGANAANLFSPAAVAAAKVLSVLTELGIQADIIGHAAPALYSHGAWRLHPFPDGNHPVMQAMREAVEKDAAWVLRIETARWDSSAIARAGNPQEGAVRVVLSGIARVSAEVFDPAGETPPELGLERRTTTLVHLGPLLKPLHPKFLAQMRRDAADQFAPISFAPVKA